MTVTKPPFTIRSAARVEIARKEHGKAYLGLLSVDPLPRLFADGGGTAISEVMARADRNEKF